MRAHLHPPTSWLYDSPRRCSSCLTRRSCLRDGGAGAGDVGLRVRGIVKRSFNEYRSGKDLPGAARAARPEAAATAAAAASFLSNDRSRDLRLVPLLLLLLLPAAAPLVRLYSSLLWRIFNVLSFSSFPFLFPFSFLFFPVRPDATSRKLLWLT